MATPAALTVILILILIGILLLFVNRYKRCPSNRILIIYGKNRTGRGEVRPRRSSVCLAGLAGIRMAGPGAVRGPY